MTSTIYVQHFCTSSLECVAWVGLCWSLYSGTWKLELELSGAPSLLNRYWRKLSRNFISNFAFYHTFLKLVWNLDSCNACFTSMEVTYYFEISGLAPPYSNTWSRFIDIYRNLPLIIHLKQEWSHNDSPFPQPLKWFLPAWNYGSFQFDYNTCLDGKLDFPGSVKSEKKLADK